jgi:hypothetical protein
VRGAEARVELAREAVPLIVIHRQLGHTNSVYLQGIDNAEIIETVHARRQPMIPSAPPHRAERPYGFQEQLTQHVIYVGTGPTITGGDIWELWRDVHGQWRSNKLTGANSATAASGAPAADGQPTGYAFEAQNTQHVDFRGTDGHIHEVWWDESGPTGWHYGGNLTRQPVPRRRRAIREAMCSTRKAPSMSSGVQ